MEFIFIKAHQINNKLNHFNKKKQKQKQQKRQMLHLGVSCLEMDRATIT
jgi:hypothetical protein